jgi:outer membrane protein assembly factor BamB
MILALCTQQVVVADNWPQFRGPTGDGHAAESTLPTTWSESRNIAWKTPVRGRGWSSPVVWANQVWLTTATHDGHALHVIRINLDNGTVEIDRQLFAIAHPQDIHLTNSHASPTPVIEEGRIYVHFGAYGTACLDTRDGRVLWQRRDFPCNHWRGPGSSPIVYGDSLILHFDGYDYQYVVALDKRTGNTRWKVDRDIDYQTDDGDFKKAFCTPTVIQVDGRDQLISPAAKATIAYQPETGEEIWRIRYRNHSATARPLFGHGLVYINSGFSKAQLFAVRPDAAGDITDSAIQWTASSSIGSKPSHLLVDDLLYVIHDLGTASCLEATTGELVWKKRVRGNYSASPVYGDGKIYLMNEEGVTTVIRPGRAYVELARNELDNGCMASPAVVGNSLIIRTKSHVYRVIKQGMGN